MKDRELGKAISYILGITVDGGRVFTTKGVKSLEGLGAMIRELTNTPAHTLQISAVIYYDCNGNGYFTVRIYWDDELVFNSGKETGGGAYYLQYAEEWLKNNGYIDRGFSGALWRYCEDNDIKFIEDCWEAESYKRFRMELLR